MKLSLPPQALALLNTISGPESGGAYNVIYGGQTVNDLSDHPRVDVPITSGPNEGKTSSAAGKYQFLKGTWDEYKQKLGLPDFSPDSQDRAAWQLAQDAYKNATGGDLTKALDSNDPAQIAKVGKALAPIWTSLPGGIEQGTNSDKFVNAYASHLNGNGAADATNAMANGTLPEARKVQTVGYVPPPFSSEQGQFTPLLGGGEQQQPSAAQQPVAAPTAPEAPSELAQPNDVMKAWGLDGPTDGSTSAPSQTDQQAQAPQTDPNDAIIKAWGLDKTDAAPAKSFVNDGTVGPTIARGGTAMPTPIGLNDAVRSVATGVPVIGGLLNKANAATNALVAPLVNPLLSDENRLKGDTYGERYANSLAEQNGMDTRYAKEHPIANTVGNVTGGVAATIPMIAAAPALMGAGAGGLVPNALMGGASGATLGGADSYVRSGGDLNAALGGAKVGGIFGAAGPVVGKAVGTVGNKLLNYLSGTTPAARNIAGVFNDIGLTPQQAQNRLTQMGPKATIADLDPALSAEAGGLASQGGAPTSILKNSFLSRAAGADDRIVQTAQTQLGPRPDLKATEDAIYAKASQEASPHYQGAENTPLDVNGVVANIDKRLETANGAEKTILTRFKSFFTDPMAGDIGAQAQKAAGEGLNDITSHIANSNTNDAGLDAARAILVRAQNGTVDSDAAKQALAQIQSADPAAQKLISDAADKLNTVTSVKTDPQSLMKVRQAMDDEIQNAPKSDTTGGKNAARAANAVRSDLDGVLKTNGGIQKGDQAYEVQMRNKDALQAGQEIFSKGTKIEDWQRSIASKSPEEVQNMQTGALSALWDALDNGRNGDWSAIRSMLGKSTANRQKLEALFPNSQNVFDTIANEAAMRGTEQTVARNSETALRQAIQNKYAPKQNPVSGAAEAMVGEAIGGGPGAAIGYLGRNALNSVRDQLAEGSRNALTEGTARGLAATGSEQQKFMNQLIQATRTNAANNAISGVSNIGGNLLLRGAGDRQRNSLLRQ